MLQYVKKLKKSVLFSSILYRFFIEFYNNFECLNDEILYFSILKSALIQTSNDNDNDSFTDRNCLDDDNTTISNNDPAAEVLHKLEPSANEHHTSKLGNIQEPRLLKDLR